MHVSPPSLVMAKVSPRHHHRHYHLISPSPTLLSPHRMQTHFHFTSIPLHRNLPCLLLSPDILITFLARANVGLLTSLKQPVITPLSLGSRETETDGYCFALTAAAAEEVIRAVTAEATEFAASHALPSACFSCLYSCGEKTGKVADEEVLFVVFIGI